MKNRFLAIILLLMTATIAIGDEPADKQVTIDDLSWMAGRWVGEAFGGTCEEVWSPPFGPSMTGSFTLVIDDKTGFYELMTLTIDDGKPALRLKHFNADLTGWEEKEKVISFPFVKLDEHHLQFDGLTYQLIDPDSLVITVSTGNSSGKADDTVIRCHRSD